MMSPVREFSKAMNQGISLWMFPVLMNDMIVSFITFSLWCIMVCEAPFKNEGYLYLVGRAGKENWVLGEILFLVLFSGVFTFGLVLSTFIFSLPRLDFTLNWGKVIGTLAYTDASTEFSIPFSFPISMMSNAAPLKTMLLSILLVWWVAFLLSAFIFTINLVFKTKLGVAFSCFLVFFDLTIYNIMDLQIGRYSLTAMSRLSNLTGRAPDFSVRWALYFLMILTIGLVFMSIICTKHRKGIE
ncbi:hypothetical protein [Novisyntrophococcus fermenticellae]|uniref:hypothetical protein n=1 Tax=Novisyntrophococcus fermenticellae TaxID=2068655 RepID=UPI001E3C1E64|nr:hypothetical protein [Novisyntrophococcus fermenticellae]